MPFEKGRAKTGGKKAGTKNKITRDVAALLDSLNCNPHEGMARIANDESVPIAIRARMFAELGQYISPKLAAMQLSGSLGLKHELGTGATRKRILEGLSQEEPTPSRESPIAGS